MRNDPAEVVDHVGLAVADLDDGVEAVRQRTGAEPSILPAEEGQWYRSAVLSMGDGCALEIVAPNPDHYFFNPLKTIIRQCTTPQLLFWYVAVPEMAQARVALAGCGARLTRIETVGGGADLRQPHCTRAVTGPGFETGRPCLIQWHRRIERTGLDGRCRIRSLEFTDPDPERLRQLMRALQISLPVHAGTASIRLTLETPRGLVSFQNPTYRHSFLRLLGAIFCDVMDTVADTGPSLRLPVDRL